MPRGDKTGPQGQGPFTGGGMGSYGKGNAQNPIAGQGQTLRQRIMAGIGNVIGLGRGRGQGSQGQGRRGGRGRNRNR